MSRLPSNVESSSMNSSTGYPREVKSIKYDSIDNHAGWGRYPGITAIRDEVARGRFLPNKDVPEEVRKKVIPSRSKYVYLLYKKGKFKGEFSSYELVEKGYFNTIKSVATAYRRKSTSFKGYFVDRRLK